MKNSNLWTWFFFFVLHLCICQGVAESHCHHWSTWCDQRPMWACSFCRRVLPQASLGELPLLQRPWTISSQTESIAGKKPCFSAQNQKKLSHLELKLAKLETLQGNGVQEYESITSAAQRERERFELWWGNEEESRSICRGLISSTLHNWWGALCKETLTNGVIN